MSKPVMYLAGGITGYTYNEAVDWRNLFASMIPDVECLSPMRGKAFLESEGILGACGQHPLTMERGIFIRDTFDVRRCDLFLANFLNSTVASIGTIFEIALAFELNKPIIIIMEEKNVHHHPFINEACSFEVGTFGEAAEIVKNILF